MNTKTFEAKQFFTKTYKKDDTVPFAWFNTEYKALTEQEIQEMKEYILKKEFIKEMIIVSGIEVARPQRTWGDMPEWFRPASWFNHFDNCYHDNSFIFVIYNSDWGKDIKEEEIEEAFKSFPNHAKTIRIERTKDNDIQSFEN